MGKKLYLTQNGFSKLRMKHEVRENFKGKAMEKVNMTCVYRTEKENKTTGEVTVYKCAVGIFIPDNKYMPSMEAQGSNRLLKEFPWLKDLMPLNMAGMADFQHQHDSINADKMDFEAQLEKLLTWIDENVATNNNDGTVYV